MLSVNSIKTFITVNSFLFMISIIQYYYLINYVNPLLIFIFIGLRNIIMERSLYFGCYKKKFIGNIDRSQIKYNYFGLFIFFLTTTFVDTITYIFIYNFYIFNETNKIKDLIYFIPVSFGFEIIFDLFHYLVHRIEHENKFLYRYIHRIHHTYSHPITIVTYYHHPIDLILSNSIPQLLTLMILPKISFFMYNVININKIFIEIAGHTGKEAKASSFPQLIQLPRFLGIELHTEDHDLHHKINNCNYSKRFNLWDIVFKTYKFKDQCNIE